MKEKKESKSKKLTCWVILLQPPSLSFAEYEQVVNIHAILEGKSVNFTISLLSVIIHMSRVFTLQYKVPEATIVEIWHYIKYIALNWIEYCGHMWNYVQIISKNVILGIYDPCLVTVWNISSWVLQEKYREFDRGHRKLIAAEKHETETGCCDELGKRQLCSLGLELKN